MLKDKFLVYLSLILVFCFALALYNFNHNASGYLAFSDAAKFADIARNIYSGNGYSATFSFFGQSIFSSINTGLFSARGNLVFTPFVISIFYYLIGINDYAVVSSSILFFLLTIVFTFLLSKSIFKNNLGALLSALSVGTNYDLINYAVSGGSESPFIFEIVAGIYFFSLGKRWATGLGILLLCVMYLTRPQAFIYICGILLFYFVKTFKVGKGLTLFFTTLVVFIFFDKIIIPRLPENIFMISIFSRGQNSLSQYLPGEPVSNALRGITVQTSVMAVFKKILYNLYNFYKLMPQIFSPYLSVFFVLGFFRKSKDSTQNIFKTSSLFMVGATFLITAASIPFFRYLHPVIPLICILGIDTLLLVIGFIAKDKFTPILSVVVVLVFVVGQTLGVLFLDSRFILNNVNKEKLPVYVILSKLLKDNTFSQHKIVTNLDTWGSWYGERSTVWFPVEPIQIVDPGTGKIPFDAIYLTDYLITDQNYVMGTNWHMIFDNPNDPSKWSCDGCKEISTTFILKGVYLIGSDSDYEKINSRAVLLVRK